MKKPTPSQVSYLRHLLQQAGGDEPDWTTLTDVEASALIDGLKSKRGRPVWHGNGQFSHWEKKADVGRYSYDRRQPRQAAGEPKLPVLTRRLFDGFFKKHQVESPEVAFKAGSGGTSEITLKFPWSKPRSKLLEEADDLGDELGQVLDTSDFVVDDRDAELSGGTATITFKLRPFDPDEDGAL